MRAWNEKIFCSYDFSSKEVDMEPYDQLSSVLGFDCSSFL
jgi:hypothetical protein